MNKYQSVKKDFLSGKFKGCKAFFESENYLVEAAYCDIILDKLKDARQKFSLVVNEDIRAHWGLCLLDMIEGNISVNPTYFEVRNFLEIDLGILISYCKGDYVEKIIKYADYMAYFNMECYKFIGRVFWAYNMMPISMFFLRIAKDKLYNDPELHYLLAYIYFTVEKKFDKCKKSLDACLKILPKYAPACALMKKITELNLA